MKKSFLIIFSAILSLFVCINSVNAEPTSMGLADLVKDEIAQMKDKEGTEEYIKILEGVNLSKYKESDDKVNVYLFRGTTCGYCLKAVAYFAQLAETMGDKFNIVSYEVWYDADNVQLLEDVGKVLNFSPRGVPCIIVGDKVFDGYDTSYNSEIEAKINEQFKLKKKKRYDVMVEKDKKPPVYTELCVFICVSIVLVVLNVVTFVVLNNKINKLSANNNVVVKEVKADEEKISAKKVVKKTTAKKNTKAKSKN